MNKYQKEVSNLSTQRDNLIVNEISLIFDSIKEKVLDITATTIVKADDNIEYFTEGNNSTEFAKDLNTAVRPEYLKKDNLSKKIYEQEYNTAYEQAKYSTVNEAIKMGYFVELPTAQVAALEKALNYPLSKLMNDSQMKTGRSVDIEQLYRTIVSGVSNGESLPQITKQIDINLGYRDSVTGKLITKKSAYKGQQYKTMRILRTEVLRMRSDAEIDQWKDQQDILPSQMKLIATLDDRTRSQSAQVDGRLSNEDGKFKYPDGKYYKPRHTGKPQWDINDREVTIQVFDDYPQESRIARNPETGKNEILPYQSYKEYAKENGLTVNKYGETLFPDED